MSERQDSKHILFITSSRIGDAVLSSGILDHIARTLPEARVTIACGPLVVSLFEGYPLLEQLYPLKKKKLNGHWICLWRQVFFRRWYMVIDLRDSAVSRLIFSKNRHIFGKHLDLNLHKAEQAAELMELDYVPATRLWVTPQQAALAEELIPSMETQGRMVIGVGPTANWVGKTWPVERFIETIRWMISESGPANGAKVAVFAAPGEEVSARLLYESLPSKSRFDLIAKTDPGTAAAALSLCSFYIGNDSGLMHCAAAAGIPTLGLFGPSYPHLYRPWGEDCDFISTPESFDELIAYEGYAPKTAGCLMGSLTVEAVKNKILKMFEKIKK